MQSRWKVITVVAVFIIFAAVGVYPIIAGRYGITSPKWLIDRRSSSGSTCKGGVHLVLRVQTDDALRHRDRGRDRSGCGKRLKTAGNTAAANITVDSPTQFKVEGIAPEQDAAFRQAAARGRDQLRPRSRRRRRLHVHDEAERAGDAARRGGRAGAPDDRAPRQRARRRRAEHRAAGRQRRPDPRPAARRHRHQPRQGDHPVDRPARAEDRRAGAGRRRARRSWSTARCPRAWRSCPAPAARPAMPPPCITWCGGWPRSRVATCAAPGPSID